MEIIWDPREIENRSMEIIEERIEALSDDPLERAIVKRIVHSTGDLDIAPLIKFYPGAVQKGARALRKGASIFTDVNMLAAGINKRKLRKYGGRVYCSITSKEVKRLAKETGKTRASVSMRRWGKRLTGQVVAIGNAPTALFELLRMIQEGIVRPALIVGTPVGFVGAAESKDELIQSNLPYISIKGTRGGSTVAAAAVNALLYYGDEKNGR